MSLDNVGKVTKATLDLLISTYDQKEYDGESIYDLGRDVEESLNGDYNARVYSIPEDEYGLKIGRFKVTIEWEE